MKIIIIYCACMALVNGISYEKCRRSDPNVEQCILDGIESVRPLLKLEPLKIDLIKADVSMSAANCKFTLKNMALYNGSNFKITSLNVDLKGYQYTGKAQILVPLIQIASDYHIHITKFMYLYFTTYGQFRAMFENLLVKVECKATPYIKRGIEYLRLESVTAQISMKNGALNMKPADNTWFGQLLALNSRAHPYDAIQRLIPAVEDTSARLFKDYINKFLSKVPLRKLLVD